MALTKEDLKLNPALTALDDTVLDAVAAMSLADENNIVGAKFRTQYDAIDALVLEITGAQKPQTTKTTEFLKTQLVGLKDKAANIDTLQAKITDLEGKITSGDGDAALKSELQLSRNTLKAAQQQVTELTEAKTTMQTDFDSKLIAFKEQSELKDLRTSFQLATNGKAFKGVDQTIGKRLLNQDIDSILSSTTREVVQGTNGKPQTIFKDKTSGLILTNPAKNMAPMTAEDIILSKAAGYLDLGKIAQGTGKKPGEVPSPAIVGDFANAKTQVEADIALTAQLLANGISTTDERYQEERDKLLEPVKEQYTKLPQGIL